METWLYHEELGDLHKLYCLKSSQLDYLISIIYPIFLLAVTYIQLIYIEIYSALLHVLGFVSCICLYMLCSLHALF
jgi:hypothetical protein